MTRIPEPLLKEIADTVREARARARLSRSQAAALCGVSPLIIHLVELCAAPRADAYLPFLARLISDTVEQHA